MARIEDIERRLLNWARWRVTEGGGSIGYASVRLSSDVLASGDRYREAVIPTSDCEAAETDGLVMKLTSELRATVENYYTGRGGEAECLKRLCIGRSTLHARIDRAHRALASMLADLQAQRLGERKRVEALQLQQGMA